jgi:hypothetical protein
MLVFQAAHPVVQRFHSCSTSELPLLSGIFLKKMTPSVKAREGWETVEPLSSTGFVNSPFTAADEKIPLSMVHVNLKPQHLVFSLHSRASDC